MKYFVLSFLIENLHPCIAILLPSIKIIEFSIFKKVKFTYDYKMEILFFRLII